MALVLLLVVAPTMLVSMLRTGVGDSLLEPLSTVALSVMVLAVATARAEAKSLSTTTLYTTSRQIRRLMLVKRLEVLVLVTAIRQKRVR